MLSTHISCLYTIWRKGFRSILIVALFVMGFGTAHAQQFIDHESPPVDSEQAEWLELQPNVEYSPEQVVQFQVEALAQNNVPHSNAGIELAYRFASPSNKAAIGSLYRFALVVYNPFYRPLLNHQTANYGTIHIEGDTAIQLVFLTTAHGNRLGYLFKLSRQQGGHYNGCWMTDEVLLLPGFQEA